MASNAQRAVLLLQAPGGELFPCTFRLLEKTCVLGCGPTWLLPLLPSDWILTPTLLPPSQKVPVVALGPPG